MPCPLLLAVLFLALFIKTMRCNKIRHGNYSKIEMIAWKLVLGTPCGAHRRGLEASPLSPILQFRASLLWDQCGLLGNDSGMKIFDLLMLLLRLKIVP